MFTFSFVEWLTLFYIYGFIGWTLEIIIVSFEQKKIVSRGFLRLPILPLYGFGASIIMTVTYPVAENPTLVFICGALACTLLEYFVGVIMDCIFNVKYWDYSTYEFNFQGKISAVSTLYWGFMSLFMTYQLLDWSHKFIDFLPDTFMIIFCCVVSVLFVTDVIYSIKTAIDIKNILMTLTTIKKKIDTLRTSGIIKESIQNEIAELNLRKQKLLSKMSFYPRALLRDNPDATSSKFSEALKDLKNSLFQSFKK